MSDTGSEKPARERLLLNRRSLEACPSELRQPLAYVLHLRSHWKPEGRAKLIVPTSWMEFLACTDGRCRTGCVANQRCPFGNVRFESVREARSVIPNEELPLDVVSQLLANGCLATLVPRAFRGIPRTSDSYDVAETGQISDAPAVGLAGSQSAPRRIDSALVSGDGALAENNARCLLLGTKEPTWIGHPPFASFDPRPEPSTSASIRNEPSSRAQLHLTLLTKLIQGGAAKATTGSFPEWLVLFSLVYDAHHVRIVAHVPHRTLQSDVTACAAYIVDRFSLRPGSVADVPTCELVLERLRLLVALTTLRRHVLHLSRSLFTMGEPCDGPSLTCNQHSSDDCGSLKRCGSLASYSEYSTCPSRVHGRELNDVPVVECGQPSSSYRSSASSFCSTCSSSLDSTSTSGSLHSEDFEYTDSDSDCYMEPPDESVTCSNMLTETRRLEIIAWARKVVPTEHPIKDTYKMVVRHPNPRRQNAYFKQVHADRPY